MNYDCFQNFDFLMLGGLFPKEIENEVFEKSIYGIQFASNTHQWKIVNGLDALLPQPVSLLNMLPVGSYPKRYKDLFIKEFAFSHRPGANDLNAGYCNLTVLKKLSRKLTVRRHIKAWMCRPGGRKKVLLIYTVQGEYLSAAVMIKKKYPDIHICLIVPDLPAFTDIDKGGSLIYRIRAAYRTAATHKRIGAIDSFVFLTEDMKDYFAIKKPYTVVEGISDDEEDLLHQQDENGIKTIVYTGTFTKKYGIMDLVKSFMMIPHQNYRLALCGDGEAVSEIMDCATRDHRIMYHGSLKRAQALALQKSATLLVNPRKGGEEFTRYSFPSKIMEYMSAGKPVMCFKLEGIPKQYDDYLIYFRSADQSSMMEDMIAVCEKEVEILNQIGIQNREFVMKEKNSRVQCGKILDMIAKSTVQSQSDAMQSAEDSIQ